ncbi:hypothetical protein [Pectobacterium actinidiae]|uniref:hypothetical protein n=1 Tax=Pectobacterium actinidiae TaxID=1507808 RepID=UPI003811AB30
MNNPVTCETHSFFSCIALGTLLDGIMVVTAIAASVVARSCLPQLTTQEAVILCDDEWLENFIDYARSQWVLLTTLARGGPSSEKKINDLVMIDSYALINRMGSGEAWTDLCNEYLQEN